MSGGLPASPDAAAYWEALRGELLAGVAKPRGEAAPPLADPERHAALLKAQGFCVTEPALAPDLVATCRSLVAGVRSRGWLPVFAFVYDELWQLAVEPAARALVAAALGPDYRRMADIYGFYVGLGYEQHGYRPHREIETPGLVDPDGAPVSLTLWLPLSDATPDNGCMYVIPAPLELERASRAELERHYSGAGGGIATHVALLHRARALPARAGSLLAWNHHLIHWGSFSSLTAAEPRVAVSFEFLRASYPAERHPHVTKLPQDVPGLLPFAPMAADAAPGTLAARLYHIAFSLYRYHHGPKDDPFFVWARGVLGGKRPEES